MTRSADGVSLTSSLPTVHARGTWYGRDSQMASALARSQRRDMSSDVLGISTDPADQ
jgi:hypothetical protein